MHLHFVKSYKNKDFSNLLDIYLFQILWQHKYLDSNTIASRKYTRSVAIGCFSNTLKSDKKKLEYF